MNITLDGISLPADMIWEDEYAWSNVTQNIQKSLNGSLIIQEVTQAKGRLITLTGNDKASWITKATLDLLKAKIDTVDIALSLDYHGTIYNVVFNRSASNQSPMQAKLIVDYTNPQADDVYSFSINLIEV